MITPQRAWNELHELLAAQHSYGKRARADDGVGTIQQLTELVRLRLGTGKLTPEDYYRMRVYRQELSFQDKSKFLSQAAVKLSKRWNIVAHDKLLTYIVLEHEGVRTPRILAICHSLRNHGAVQTLRSVEDVRTYLMGATEFPFVTKPVTGVFSRDVHLVKGVDRVSDRVQLEDGDQEIAEFARNVITPTDGTLFQELLIPHRDIVAHISSRLCTLRLIVILDRGDVRLLRAYWKIAGGNNLADNYWRPGNFIALIDADTGRILRCVTGLGPDFHIFDKHPLTGMALAGHEVPCFAEAVALAIRIAPAFAGMRMQAWDIAITDDGPIALEVNEEGSVFLPQLADGYGLNDNDFQEFRNHAPRN
jgi:hypothetical protein